MLVSWVGGERGEQRGGGWMEWSMSTQRTDVAIAITAGDAVLKVNPWARET